MGHFKTKSILSLAAVLLWSSAVKAETVDCHSGVTVCQYEITITPGEYEWQDGVIKGYATEYKIIPTQWAVSGTNANGKLIKASTKSLRKRVVAEHAQPLERLLPFEVQDGRTRVQTKKPIITERLVPVKFGQ